MELYTDSSAAMGVCSRKGIGKVRHLDTNLLWIQDKLKQGTFVIKKIHGEKNPADLFTKHMDNGKRLEQLGAIGCAVCTGRVRAGD